MLDRAGTGVPVGQLPRVGFRVSDELVKALSWHRWMHGDAQDIGGDAGNRVQIFDGIIERLAFKQRLVDMRLRPAKQDRVAVRSGPCDGGSSQRRAPATDVFNHHRSEQGLHLVRQWAANGIERTTWRERNNESDRPCWIALRRSKAREDRKRGSADDYLQKFPAGKPQTALPTIRLQYLVCNLAEEGEGPLVARSGHARRVGRCPLAGVQRTSNAQMCSSLCGVVRRFPLLRSQCLAAGDPAGRTQ